MPDLMSSLNEQDAGHLRIIAGFWGMELDESTLPAMLSSLVKTMLQPQILAEMVESLPADARSALETLQTRDGRIPWSVFSGRFGGIREMGAARRDRETPHLSPVSSSEILFYRGFIARAFLNLTGDPREYAYIPGDLLDSLPLLTREGVQHFGKPADAQSHAVQKLADDTILDHLCTLLASVRGGVNPLPHLSGMDFPPRTVLQALLEAAGILDQQGLPDPEAARRVLEVSRGSALVDLISIWLQSSSFDELRLIPDLIFEGEWKNDPLKPRRFLMEQLANLPVGAWWNLDSFIAEVRLRVPEFLRSGGEFDSWYIRPTESTQFLRGIEHWGEVEGAYLRYVISGPLHWLGLVDLGYTEVTSSAPASFRLSRWRDDLLQGKSPADLSVETDKITIYRSGKLVVPRLAPRSVRYQTARFCDWDVLTEHGYEYRLTPASFRRARRQGLRPVFLITLLRKYGAAPPQPNLVRAIERWDEKESQAVLEPATVLRVSSPEILTELRASKASRYLGDSLGPAAVMIKPGSLTKVQEALVELGYLSEVKTAEPDAV